MTIALYVLLAAAVALAWVVARRRAAHVPIALALSVAAAADLAGIALLAWVLPNPPPAAPLEGALRIAVYFERALFIAWPFALAAAAVRVLARCPAWPVAIGYAVAVGVLVLGYPALRFGALRKAYLAIELAALLVDIAAFVAWYRRAYRREQGDVATRTATALVLGHAAMVITTYGGALFGEGWVVAQAAYVAVLGAVVVIELVEVLA